MDGRSSSPILLDMARELTLSLAEVDTERSLSLTEHTFHFLHLSFTSSSKIGNSTTTGKPSAPMWNYKLGLQQGWMPDNPNEEAVGACSSIGSQVGADVPTSSWGSTFQDWMTGASTAT